MNSHKFIHILIKKNGVSSTITGIYRLCSNDVHEFVDDLENLQNNYPQTDCDIDIFTGDININILDKTNRIVNDYLNCLSEKGFHSVINMATRVDKYSSTCLDHFFVKQASHYKVEGAIVNSGLTDHYPIVLSFIKLNRNSPNSDGNSSKAYKYAYKLNDKKLTQLLQQENWDELLSIKDSDECIIFFINRLLSLKNKSTLHHTIKS